MKKLICLSFNFKFIKKTQLFYDYTLWIICELHLRFFLKKFNWRYMLLFWIYLDEIRSFTFQFYFCKIRWAKIILKSNSHFYIWNRSMKIYVKFVVSRRSINQTWSTMYISMKLIINSTNIQFLQIMKIKYKKLKKNYYYGDALT